MKNIFNKLLLVVGLAFLVGSCEKDDDFATLNPDAVLTATANKTALVLIKDDLGKEALKDTWTAPEYGFSAAADYRILLDVKGNNLKTEISGSGNITLKGYATTNDIVMSGSGSMNAFACELETVKIKMSGSGTCELSASASLDAVVLGSGTIKHKGNTKNVSKKVYGSGVVDRAY